MGVQLLVFLGFALRQLIPVIAIAPIGITLNFQGNGALVNPNYPGNINF